MKPLFYWRVAAGTQAGSQVSSALDAGGGEWTTKDTACFKHTAWDSYLSLPQKITWPTEMNRAEKYTRSTLNAGWDISYSERGSISLWHPFAIQYWNMKAKVNISKVELSVRSEFLSRDIYQQYFHSCISTYFSQVLHCISPRLAL